MNILLNRAIDANLEQLEIVEGMQWFVDLIAGFYNQQLIEKGWCNKWEIVNTYEIVRKIEQRLYPTLKQPL
jgi:hypothetical protein